MGDPILVPPHPNLRKFEPTPTIFLAVSLKHTFQLSNVFFD